MNKCPGLCDQVWPQCDKCETENYCLRICMEHNVPLTYCKDCCPCERINNDISKD